MRKLEPIIDKGAIEDWAKDRFGVNGSEVNYNKFTKPWTEQAQQNITDHLKQITKPLPANVSVEEQMQKLQDEREERANKNYRKLFYIEKPTE